MVSFKQLGLAEGIYKGLGNVGSAVAAITLPTLALMFGAKMAGGMRRPYPVWLR
jgi:hypothetical protein